MFTFKTHEPAVIVPMSSLTVGPTPTCWPHPLSKLTVSCKRSFSISFCCVDPVAIISSIYEAEICHEVFVILWMPTCDWFPKKKKADGRINFDIMLL